MEGDGVEVEVEVEGEGEEKWTKVIFVPNVFVI